jgi:hypothetical protein
MELLSAHGLIQRVVGWLSSAASLRLQAIRTRAAEHLDPGAQPQIKPKMRIGYASFHAEALQQAVLAAVQREGAPFQTFAEYHGWYVSHADTPSHGEVWPIELDPDVPGSDHRGWVTPVHRYVRAGLKVVPAIYRVS